MGRQPLRRRVGFLPQVTYFKPAGVPLAQLQEVRLSIEEAEAIRLKDIEGLEQDAGAEKMSVSRSTFARTLLSARRKTADALLSGKAIRIEGGNYELTRRSFRCGNGHEWEVPFEKMIEKPPELCPTCDTANIMALWPWKPGLSGGRQPGGGKNYQKGGTMKIAISAGGQSPDAEVDPRFGRCPYFIIADTETGGFEAVANPGTTAAGGAGISAARMIVKKGAGAVLTGSCGPNAQGVLSSAGVRIITGVSGKVKDAIAEYKPGNDAPAPPAGVPEHTGKGTGGGGEVTPDRRDLEALKEQSQALAEQLAEIQRRIEELGREE